MTSSVIPFAVGKQACVVVLQHLRVIGYCACVGASPGTILPICGTISASRAMGKVFEKLEIVTDIDGEAFTSPLPLGPEGLLHGKLENGLR